MRLVGDRRLKRRVSDSYDYLLGCGKYVEIADRLKSIRDMAILPMPNMLRTYQADLVNLVEELIKDKTVPRNVLYALVEECRTATVLSKVDKEIVPNLANMDTCRGVNSVKLARNEITKNEYSMSLVTDRINDDNYSIQSLIQQLSMTILEAEIELKNVVSEEYGLRDGMLALKTCVDLRFRLFNLMNIDSEISISKLDLMKMYTGINFTQQPYLTECIDERVRQYIKEKEEQLDNEYNPNESEPFSEEGSCEVPNVDDKHTIIIKRVNKEPQTKYPIIIKRLYREPQRRYPITIKRLYRESERRYPSPIKGLNPVKENKANSYNDTIIDQLNGRVIYDDIEIKFTANVSRMQEWLTKPSNLYEIKYPYNGDRVRRLLVEKDKFKDLDLDSSLIYDYCIVLTETPISKDYNDKYKLIVDKVDEDRIKQFKEWTLKYLASIK